MRQLSTVAGCLALGVLLGLLGSNNSREPSPLPTFLGGLLGLVAGLALAFPRWPLWSSIFGPPDDQRGDS